MKVEKLEVCPQIFADSEVKYTEMGNIIEVQYMSKRNKKQTIQMLQGAKQFIVCATGEIKDIVPNDFRLGSKKNLQKTFKYIRDLINTNVTDLSRVRWITLTYAENMKDTKRLYEDFEKFNKRFQYFCTKKNNFGKAEYIVVMEPQQRGAWHAHLLYIWACKAPYISNSDLADIWRQGFVVIQDLSKRGNIDNLGAYLSAYLGDMDISQEQYDSIKSSNVGLEVKEIEVEENSKKTKKYFVKGGRLFCYPAKFNIIRHSRGIKKPVGEFMTYSEAMKKVLGATKTFEKTVHLSDDETAFETVINTCYYNRVRENKQ